MFRFPLPQTALKKIGLCASATLLAVAAGSQTQSHAHSQSFGSVKNRVRRVAQNTNQKSVQVAAAPSWGTIEQNLITEHSRVRQDPQSYIPMLEGHLASMDSQGNIPNGCGPNCTLLTQEGRSAVEEAISFLRNQDPVRSVNVSSDVARAAKAHARDQADGAVGHTSSDGTSFAERLDSFGIKSGGENIAYGPDTARQVIMNLIIDDGVANRGHRTNIFSPRWSVAGAGCGPHAAYGTVCVINYATE